MSTWHDYVKNEARIPEWPYPVDYGKENEINCDVLIIGGGVAGCHAAVSAARHGAKVVVADRGNAKRSGAGGAGVDHWHGAVTNPCSKVKPLDYTLACYNSTRGFTSGIARYIITKESWDTLLEMEQMGVRIRDIEDEFKGAPFRDEETKLMFAYDYVNRHVLRVWGYNMKPALYAEMKRLGIGIFNRMMVTSLLTEGGRQGARVSGAAAVNTRTGEFYIFKAGATIISTGGTGRLGSFAPEMTAAGGMSDLNNSGTGHAIGWKAGAEFVLMEQSGPARLSGFGFAPYSMGNSHNTYHGVSIVDADGKEVPWVDALGNPINTLEERFSVASGQPFQLGAGIGIGPYLPEYRSPELIHDLPERIRRGEFRLPLYADLTKLPEYERRCIWGMMVGNEGKTRIPIYDRFSKAGFDPDQDLLQAPVMNPEWYSHPNFWSGPTMTHLRSLGGGGLLTDWDLRTSLEGLYGAGGAPIFGSGCHGESHTTGRYAGRQAAAYSRSVSQAGVDRRQINAEKARVYAFVRNSDSGIGWKELNQATARIMQDYCGKYKSELTLNLGLRLLKELRENEAASACAANPHELGRLLECFSVMDVGELVFQSSLARKSSNSIMDFYRLDYPALDPQEWDKLLPIRLEDGKAKVRELPKDYHLKAPFKEDYEANYREHCRL